MLLKACFIQEYLGTYVIIISSLVDFVFLAEYYFEIQFEQ